jgi:hypothetical protein
LTVNTVVNNGINLTGLSSISISGGGVTAIRNKDGVITIAAGSNLTASTTAVATTAQYSRVTMSAASSTLQFYGNGAGGLSVTFQWTGSTLNAVLA